MNKELNEFIKQNNEIVVTGLEGCGKSKDVMDTIVNGDICKDGIAIYATQSFKQLHEKQSELIKYYGLTKDQCPIVSVSDTIEEHNRIYIDNVSGILSPSAKIVMITVSALQKCLHLTRLKIENSNIFFSSLIKSIIIDEFDFASCIIPRLDYLTNDILFAKRKKVDKSIIEYIRQNYTSQDAVAYSEIIKTCSDAFLVAHYLRYNQFSKIKTIFVTSERVPLLILEQMGFNSFSISETNGNGEYTDKFNHTIHFHANKVNSDTFNKLNIENKWGIFGFNTIISDCYTDSILKSHQIDEIEIINHQTMKGSNNHKEKDILTIISHIPDLYLQSICDCINWFSEGTISFDDLKTLYYRDRLYQAVGRVIGHRATNQDETWVIMHYLIAEGIEEAISSNKIIMNYNLEKWDMDNPDWEDLIDRASSDRRTKQSINKSHNGKKYDRAKQLALHFLQLGNKEDRLLVSDLKQWMIDNGISGKQAVRPKFIAECFGLPIKQSSRRVGNSIKVYSYIPRLQFK